MRSMRTPTCSAQLVLTLVACLTVVFAAALMPGMAFSQGTGEDDCKEGSERLPDAKECTPIEWTGPVIDPGLIETQGPDWPDPVLILPTIVPQPTDPAVTPYPWETPSAPTPAPRAFGMLTITGVRCPHWYMAEYANRLIPPCSPLPGLTVSIVSEGVLIAADVTTGTKDPSAPAQVMFAEVPAGKILIEQKYVPGYEYVQVTCGHKGEAVLMPLAGKASVVVELGSGEHLTCSFVNVTRK